MPRNPYLNRSMIRSVEEFHGRRRELQRVMSRIGAQTPQSVSLVGERRMGKSSLLWYLSQPEIYAEHLEEPDRYVFVFIDCQGQQHVDQEGLHMNSYVPLISTRSVGPLGIAHLPRLWLKLRVSAKNKLAEGYRSGQGGWNGVVLTHLGLDLDDVVRFIEESQPSYVEFEAWVNGNASPESLTKDAIAEVNEQMMTYEKSGDPRATQLEFVGLPIDEKVWLGVELNDLDDWHAFHLALRDE